MTYAFSKKFMALLFTAMLALCFMGCGNKTSTLNLSDYYSIELEGYNSAGVASIKRSDGFDMALMQALADSKTIESPTEAALFTALSANPDLITLIDTMNSESFAVLDKKENLSNGDTVTLSFNYNNDLYKESGVRLDGDSIELTVEGLDEIEAFDAFEGLSVKFSGIAPDGMAEITNKPNSDINYQLDNSSGLRNGDVVTVTLESRRGDDNFSIYATENGKIPQETQKQFTVEGLPEYIDSFDAIPAEAWGKLKTEMADQKTANIDIVNSYTDGVFFVGVSEWAGAPAGQIDEITNFTWDKAILLTLKDGANPGGFDPLYNRLYLVYSCDVGAKEEFGLTITAASDMIGAFYIDNLRLDPDGTMLIPSADIWYTDAVKNVDDFTNDNVSVYQADYSVDEMPLNW